MNRAPGVHPPTQVLHDGICRLMAHLLPRSLYPRPLQHLALLVEELDEAIGGDEQRRPPFECLCPGAAQLDTLMDAMQ